MEYPFSIQKLIEKFSKFPTIGPKTAARFVFYLLQQSKEEVLDLTKSITDLKQNTKKCESCFNFFEDQNSEQKLCKICSNPQREKSLLCVVANETDLMAIENTNKFKGFYFVLGGTVSGLKKESVEKLRIKELEEKIKNNAEITEIIIATNPNSDGDATALYLERMLKLFNKKITRLGRGIPTGGELEYADEETLISALEGRK